MHVSVVIPAFNAAPTIGGCLSALRAQNVSQTDFQVIVVDDGSSDETSARVSQFEEARLEHTPHLGAAGARNHGARLATGEILLFTDADCEPTETWIQEMCRPFENQADIAGAKGVYLTRQRAPVARFVQIEYEEKYEQMRRLERIDFIDTYSAAYRREVFLANGGFDESFPGASVEDQEFSFRLAKQGYRLVFAPNARVCHSHVSTWRAYAKRKFRIGYWKVHLHRRHPDKVWQDSHTPLTLKLQVILILALPASIALALLFPVFWWTALGACVGLVVSSVPLLMLIARRDPRLLLPACGLICLRAAALAAGLVAGVLGELARNRRAQT